jgi:tripeptidyl-peptidase-1
MTRLLNIPFLEGTLGPDSPSSLEIYECSEYYEQTDLDLYWKEFFPSRIPEGYGPTFASIDGSVRFEQLLQWTGDGLSEPAMDLQSTIPLYYPGKVTNIQSMIRTP